MDVASQLRLCLLDVHFLAIQVPKIDYKSGLRVLVKLWDYLFNSFSTIVRGGMYDVWQHAEEQALIIEKRATKEVWRKMFLQDFYAMQALKSFSFPNFLSLYLTLVVEHTNSCG